MNNKTSTVVIPNSANRIEVPRLVFCHSPVVPSITFERFANLTELKKNGLLSRVGSTFVANVAQSVAGSGASVICVHTFGGRGRGVNNNWKSLRPATSSITRTSLLVNSLRLKM